MSESWKAIAGWPPYIVSSMGRVAKLRRNRPPLVLKPKLAHEKYLAVTLTSPAGRAKTFYVHILVCNAFHGAKPVDRPFACHNNGNSLDNRAGNLRWDDQKGNEADKALHGTKAAGARHGRAKLSEEAVGEIRRQLAAGMSPSAIAAEHGVTKGCIYAIKSGRRWAN